MNSKRNMLVWMDLEMTGLEPTRDRIIEIATIVTDGDLEVVAEGPVLAVHQPDALLQTMDEWNTRTHNETGLVKRVRESTTSEQQADRITMDFLSNYVAQNQAPLCGNSICQDRRFLYRYMPLISGWLHYRNVDVTSFKEMAQRWRPDLVNNYSKRNTHRALDDIRESIDELKYYRRHFIRQV